MSRTTLKRVIRFIPLTFWASLIFYLSSQNAVSAVSQREADIALHKLAHLMEYAILYIFVVLAFYKDSKHFPKTVRNALIFIGLYAISDEVHQSFNPTRSPRVIDVLIDLCGGILGYLLLKTARKFQTKIPLFQTFR